MTDSSKIEELSNNLKEYARVQYEMILLQLTSKMSVLGSWLMLQMISTVFILCFFICISLAGGFYFSELLESRYAGFLIMAGILFLGYLLYLVIRKRMIAEPLKDRIIQELLKDMDASE